MFGQVKTGTAPTFAKFNAKTGKFVVTVKTNEKDEDNDFIKVKQEYTSLTGFPVEVTRRLVDKFEGEPGEKTTEYAVKMVGTDGATSVVQSAATRPFMSLCGQLFAAAASADLGKPIDLNLYIFAKGTKTTGGEVRAADEVIASIEQGGLKFGSVLKKDAQFALPLAVDTGVVHKGKRIWNDDDKLAAFDKFFVEQLIPAVNTYHQQVQNAGVSQDEGLELGDGMSQGQ